MSEKKSGRKIHTVAVSSFDLLFNRVWFSLFEQITIKFKDQKNSLLKVNKNMLGYAKGFESLK